MLGVSYLMVDNPIQGGLRVKQVHGFKGTLGIPLDKVGHLDNSVCLIYTHERTVLQLEIEFSLGICTFLSTAAFIWALFSCPSCLEKCNCYNLSAVDYWGQ